jgi:adenosylcobinamide-phosphate synthase
MLCGRDPSVLDGADLVRAVVESVAENTSDAAVGSLWWGALAGLPGLVAYRAINTLDAMIGHHSERYEAFGWAAARLDDLVNLVPARLTALLTMLLAPTIGGRPSDAWRAWRRDAAAHPSPNAGPCEATFAGALGVQLGGLTTYSYGVSLRPILGDGRRVEISDIGRATRLSSHVTFAAAVLCAGLALVVHGDARRRLASSL